MPIAAHVHACIHLSFSPHVFLRVTCDYVMTFFESLGVSGIHTDISIKRIME